MPQHISCLDIPLKYLNGCNVCRNKMFPTKILDMLLVFFTNLLPTDLMEGKMYTIQDLFFIFIFVKIWKPLIPMSELGTN